MDGDRPRSAYDHPDTVPDAWSRHGGIMLPMRPGT